MQREMDFMELIDWGREADLVAVTSYPPHLTHPHWHEAALVYLDVLKFVAPELISSQEDTGVRFIFRGANVKNLCTAGAPHCYVAHRKQQISRTQ